MKRSLRSWIWRVPIDQEVDDEIEFHLEMRTRELIAAGMEPEAARDLARRRLGNAEDFKQTCRALGRKRDREMHITQWLEDVGDDVRFALRQLRRAPAFTFVAAVTLALGIGANSAIFALVDATLLRPLPFRDPDRLVMALETTATSPRAGVSPANLFDWNERNHTFERMGAFIPNVGGMVMTGADGNAETVSRQWVTSGFFETLGVTPLVGRVFNASDDKSQSAAAVLSEAFWRTRFNGDPSIVGKEYRLDGIPFTFVGVVPDAFQWPGRSSIWGLRPIPGRPPQRGGYFLQVVGRMKPGVTPEAANADLTRIAAALAQEFPRTNTARSATLEPLHDALIGSELRLTSLLFLGVVGFVLLICCANVANLLLARATVRTRELAIRSALGAGRQRVVRQLLTESLVLAIVGGALGVAVGAAILRVAPAMLPQELLTGAVTLGFNARVALFGALAALLVGLLFGLAPAWQATDFSAAQVIASSRGTTRQGGRLRGLLVVGEVATAVLLLFGAGLLLRTLVAVETVDHGYGADEALTMMVDPLSSSYPARESLQRFLDEVTQEVQALPGVRQVAWASTLPLGTSTLGNAPFQVVGDPPVDESRAPSADYQIVSPTYFRALDLPIVQGRAFGDGDTAGSGPVCIVNEAFARTQLRGRSPLGLRLSIPGISGQPVVREIVGVARQVKDRPDETTDLLQVYVPMPQDPFDDMYLIVTPTTGRASALASSVRSAIGRVDKAQLVSVRDVVTLADVASEATSRHRFRALLVITFAGLALLLAMIGVFGILGYSVQQRVREFGVRRALGASTRDVLQLVVWSAARLIVAGVAIGLALSAILSRLLTTVLFGVQPLDLVTFASVTVVVVLTAALSVAGPAWRAIRVAPAIALRGDD